METFTGLDRTRSNTENMLGFMSAMVKPTTMLWSSVLPCYGQAYYHSRDEAADAAELRYDIICC
jgi:hypothetical protein